MFDPALKHKRSGVLYKFVLGDITQSIKSIDFVLFERVIKFR